MGMGAAFAEDFCFELLSCGDLPSKLRAPRTSDGKLLPFRTTGEGPRFTLESPARDETLRLHKGGNRLPSFSSLNDPKARAECLRRFAHHELQAIELFAWGVLRFSSLPAALRRGFLLVLEEEQAHLRLYLDRLAAHGEALSDGPLSDYLWQHRARIDSHEDPALAFLCALGLTFEQANLDFALTYRDAFAKAGDAESAAVLQRVHDDEIRHVRLAVRWLRKLKAPGESDVAAYQRATPFPLSAARAKGKRFDATSRRLAGFDDAFIRYVEAAEPYKPPAAEPPPAPSLLWLLPNLGAEESQAVPKTARGFLRGLYGAWASLFSDDEGAPFLLPPGDQEAQAAWRRALGACKGAALPGLSELSELARGQLVAWLNTPSAVETGQAKRLTLFGPPPDVTLAVHDKAFAQQAAESLLLTPDCVRGHIAVFSTEECADSRRASERLRALLRNFPNWTAPRFVLKPRLSTSGRGRCFGELRDGEIFPSVPESTWRHLAARGGAILEPWLERIADLSVQLLVRPSGVEVLGTTMQLLTLSGQILGNRGVVDAHGALRCGIDDATEAALIDAATQLGQAAAVRGFFGIAGVDAFTFYGPKRQPLLRPIVELNARYTTGTVALGLVRRLATQNKVTSGAGWALVLKTPDPTTIAAAQDVSCLCPLPRGPALLTAPSPSLLEIFQKS